MALLEHPLPDKYFYTIGDVSRLTSTKPHILRYWESQFKLLRPARRYSGHRKYTQREIDLINRIRYLIQERRFTLAGAKREINRQVAGKSTVSTSATSVAPAPSSAVPFLKELKKEIDECLSLMGSGQPTQQELIKF
jgi:DNA-binding transcriptional MerR regulator